ncbi:MAG TPA: chorismate-binding protein, partial [Pilimelia sp.]|nr:chorismate-binding protein [Pilimelia sp.]
MTIARPAAPAAADLLAAYRPGSPFFFASPRGTLLADGVYFGVPRSVRAEGLADLPTRVAAVLDLARAAGHDAPIVVGAVPFDHTAQAHLAVPDRVWRAGPLPTPLPTPPELPAAGTPRVTEVPAARAYADAVRRAVTRLDAGELDKVVLGRSLRLIAGAPFDPAALLRRLAGRDPGGHTFAVDLGAGRTLVGASPELLVARRGVVVTANPLAGSVARAADPVEDRRRAAALLASAKDRREHALVVEAVAGALRPLCAELTVPAEPEL